MIYFIKLTDDPMRVKIGCTSRPIARLQEIQRVEGRSLQMIAVIDGEFDLEAKIQNFFADDHLGNEWFATSPPVREFLGGIVLGFQPDQLVDLGAPSGNIRQLRASRAKIAAVVEIIKSAGGYARISSAARCTHSTIRKWEYFGIPERHWPLVVLLTGVSVGDIFEANQSARDCQQEMAA